VGGRAIRYSRDTTGTPGPDLQANKLIYHEIVGACSA
jgi:hypothetical protein